MKNLILAVVVVVVVFAARPAHAQIPVKPTETKPEATPNLTLSTQEKEFLRLLSSRILPVQTGLQESWNQLLATEDEKEALNLWLKARLLNIKSQGIQKEFTEWFEKIKVIHHCPDCTLEGDKLALPKPAATQSPTPAKP